MTFGGPDGGWRGRPEWWLALTAESAVRELGQAAGWFPSAGELPRVGVWPRATLWFDRSGRCYRAQLRRGAPLSVQGVRVLEGPYGAAVRRLEREGVDLVLGRRGFACPAEGVKVARAKRFGLARGAVAAEVVAADDISVRIEGLRVIARRVLGPRRSPAQFAGCWARSFPGSLAGPPRSDLRLVEDEMDKGNWAEAVDFFIIAVDELGVEMSSGEREAVNRWASELGAEKRLA